MKRAVGLILIIFLFMVGYFSVWGSTPFVPVFDSSMEPALQSGSVLIIKPVGATGVKEGDIVIYNVPRLIRETYNYPPVVARRIIEVKKGQPGSWLSLKSDNTGEDPFSVRQQDIRGTLGGQIPYLGLPLFLFQSEAATIFMVIIIVLLALYLYSSNIGISIGRRFRTFISPIVEEDHRVSLVLSNRFEATERALEGFSNAMQLYAQHLASHTSAIQGLSEASQSLKGSAAEQNRILSQMTKVFTQQRSKDEVSKIQGVVYDFERRTREALQAKNELEKEILVQKRQTHTEPLVRVKVQSSPRGCAVKPKALLTRPHYYSN
jgi:signal peptidase I